MVRWQLKMNCASLRARISRTSKRRTSVTFIEALPKTATGKIQKYVLRGGRSAIAKQ